MEKNCRSLKSDKPYNPYNSEANMIFSQESTSLSQIPSLVFSFSQKNRPYSQEGGAVMRTQKINFFGKKEIPGAQDYVSLRKNFQKYRGSIAIASHKMFWVSLAITASFLLSKLVLLVFR